MRVIPVRRSVNLVIWELSYESNLSICLLGICQFQCYMLIDDFNGLFEADGVESNRLCQNTLQTEKLGLPGNQREN